MCLSIFDMKVEYARRTPSVGQSLVVRLIDWFMSVLDSCFLNCFIFVHRTSTLLNGRLLFGSSLIVSSVFDFIAGSHIRKSGLLIEIYIQTINQT